MTEAGEKWAREKRAYAVVEDAEFWIRAFCEEVEKRMEGRRDEPESLVDAYWAAKRELLGPTPPSVSAPPGPREDD